jgi:hypothetical protein
MIEKYTILDDKKLNRIHAHLKTEKPLAGDFLSQSIDVILHYVLVLEAPLGYAHRFLVSEGLTCKYAYFARWVKNHINFNDYALVSGEVIKISSTGRNDNLSGKAENTDGAERNATYITNSKNPKTSIGINAGVKAKIARSNAIKVAVDKSDAESNLNEQLLNSGKIDANLEVHGVSGNRQEVLAKVAGIRGKIQTAFGKSAAELIHDAKKGPNTSKR